MFGENGADGDKCSAVDGSCIVEDGAISDGLYTKDAVFVEGGAAGRRSKLGAATLDGFGPVGWRVFFVRRRGVLEFM